MARASTDRERRRRRACFPFRHGRGGTSTPWQRSRSVSRRWRRVSIPSTRAFGPILPSTKNGWAHAVSMADQFTRTCCFTRADGGPNSRLRHMGRSVYQETAGLHNVRINAGSKKMSQLMPWFNIQIRNVFCISRLVG